MYSFLAASQAERMEQRLGGAMSAQCDKFLSRQAKMYLHTSCWSLGIK